MAIVAALAGSADAAAPAAEPDAAAVDAEEAKREAVPFHLDLGSFHVRDWRPTRNESPDLRFAVVVAFSAETPDVVRERLAHWVNRLRDQAIVAVRLAETKDFSEPELARVKRLVRVRIARVLPRLSVDAVLLTDFALGDD